MIGIALMGAGRMARVHAKAIAAAGGKLVAVYDVVEPAAKSLAADTGASVARSAEEALDRSDVAAVLVVTSSNTHVDFIVKAVQAGKAVMCEKPLAPNLSDAQRCIDILGPQAGRVFLAFNRRFDPGHAELKEAIDRGEIGNLEQLTITSRDPAPPPLDYIPNSGGLFRDMMIHDFDMARWILGQEPISIYSYGSCLVDPQIGKLGDIDTACVTMVTQSGRQAVILIRAGPVTDTINGSRPSDQPVWSFLITRELPVLSDIPARVSAHRIAFSISTWTAMVIAIAGKSKRFLVVWQRARRRQ
jgi:myo-inositol 2-dehydrogenase/D-chiro-inositol 1-dehydrogenase